MGARSLESRASLAAQVSQMVSRELEKECIVVFDEAHNIDNVCIEVRAASDLRNDRRTGQAISKINRGADRGTGKTGTSQSTAPRRAAGRRNGGVG